jgi:hypothetical protein
MGEQANVDLATAIYDAFRRGDVAGILNRLDAQADLQFEATSAIPWAGHWQGREGWARFFQAIGGMVVQCQEMTNTAAEAAACAAGR